MSWPNEDVHAIDTHTPPEDRDLRDQRYRRPPTQKAADESVIVNRDDLRTAIQRLCDGQPIDPAIVARLQAAYTHP
jgi:hypothetical protein